MADENYDVDTMKIKIIRVEDINFLVKV